MQMRIAIKEYKDSLIIEALPGLPETYSNEVHKTNTQTRIQPKQTYL